MGARLAENFRHNRPHTVDDLLAIAQLFTHPASLADGLPFSLTLLAILLAHELGHYVACRYYGIDASLPYFLPAPTLIGTFGAFIRIRSAIYSKRALFDVGIAGPIAGFVSLLPALAIGLAWSKIIPGIGAQGDFHFSVPLLERLLAWLIMPGVPVTDIHLHPVGQAAWVGVFATALNLLPVGQLDGGHILYSLVGDYHRPLSRLFLAAMVPLGIFYSYSWFIWAGLLFFFAMRHPRIYDGARMDAGRRKLGLLALAMLVLCFTASPIHEVSR
ncbi:MAG: site-2 protease family protein [Acidobacteria bacterium]|nr:site-2 protease family protein [Acidobacteriota bacterium]MBI3278224.1 site-2 protease family protein [Acidobacteriota bacterium]